MSCLEIYDKLPWFEKLMINVVKNGPLPRHLGIIMDGNRRFADKIKIKRETGLQHGFDRFMKVMEWCIVLGIKELTVYALSIENFKRPQNEVDFMYYLMKTKFELFMDHLDYYIRNGVRFKIIGNISLLPKHLQAYMAKLMLATQKCSVVQINFAIAYTSREEISTTIKLVVDGVENNEIEVVDIDELFITQCLYTRESPAVDLLMRTSGETRLSDFLLWQSASSKLIFMETLWPEISLWHFIYHIIRYQKMVLLDQGLKYTNKINFYSKDSESDNQFLRKQSFLDKMAMKTEQMLNHLSQYEQILT